MRTLPAALAEECATVSPRIGYLVEIKPVRYAVADEPIRFCSMTDIEWDGHSWPHRDFVMPTPPTWAGNSAMEWSMATNNMDRVIGGIALTLGLRAARFRMWILACANPRPALADVMAYPWGWLVDDSVGSQTVEAALSTEYSIESMTPRQRIYKPEFNWPPPLNSTHDFGGSTIQFTDGVST